MKRLLILAVMAAALLALLVAPPLASAAIGQPTVITQFPLGIPGWGSFAESMAADSHGDLYASLTYFQKKTNIGEVWRVDPYGPRKMVASIDVSFSGMLSGAAFDSCGRLYVAVVDFSLGEAGGIEPGVYRLADGQLERVVTLPTGSWPNGLAFRGSYLYISDSSNGAVWKVHPGQDLAAPTVPWLQDELLAPGDYGLGINGIAFREDQLYGVVYDLGRVVRIPVNADGSAGPVATVCEDQRLVEGDGVAFDVLGRLWITTNGSDVTPSGGLYRVSRSGAVSEIAKDPGWLNYPVQPVFGRTLATATKLFVLNGAFYNYLDGSKANIIALPVGVIGLIH